MNLRTLFLFWFSMVAVGRVPVVLVSMDGFRHDYMSRTETPAFDEMKINGAYAQNGMRPSMVTKTFPNHYSIVTGLYEESHGIVGNSMYDSSMKNSKFRMGNNPEYKEWWGGEPIWQTAEKLGIKSAVYFWPGSETNKTDGLDEPTYLMPYNGSVPFKKRIDDVIGWLQEDDPPSLILLYFDEPDTTGHKYSPKSNQIITKIKEMDTQLSLLRRGISDTGIEVNLVIVSDHGMVSTPANQTIEIASFFDLSQYTTSGVLHISQTSPILSLHIDREEHPQEYSSILNGLRNVNPHMDVYERNQLPERWHLKGTTRIGDIVCLAEEGWTIIPTASDYPPLKGQHGFDNKLDSMRALFIASGPSFISNSTLEEVYGNVDIFPLLCNLLDVPTEDIPLNNGTLTTFSEVLQSRNPTRSHWISPQTQAVWRSDTARLVVYPPTSHEFTVFEKTPFPSFHISVQASLQMPKLGSLSPSVASLIDRISFMGDVSYVSCISDGTKPTFTSDPVTDHHVGQMITITWGGCSMNPVLLKKESKEEINLTAVIMNKRNEPIESNVKWTIRHPENEKYPYKNSDFGKAKNIILVVGDGMSVPMLTAARMISRKDLPTDKFPFTGMARTHSMGTIITDSAASATALNTGHKTVNSALGVYPDTTLNPVDNPRMETLGEYCKHKMNMRIGIVTTSSLVDATPAGVFAHCSERSADQHIAEQSLEFQADVMLGGGYEPYTKQDTLSKFTSLGYTTAVEQNASAVLSPLLNRKNLINKQPIPSKLIGVFADGNLPTHYNRKVSQDEGKYPKEVNLPDMAEAALEVLTDSEKGFYLMVEAASIDKQAHACDSARMLDEVLELQRTLIRIQLVLSDKGITDETLIVVTSDHSTGGYDVYGTVDTKGKTTGADSINHNINQYSNAGYPDWKSDSEFEIPTSLWRSAQWTLAGVNVNHPSYKEDFKAKTNLKEWWIEDKETLNSLKGIQLASNIGYDAHEEAFRLASHTGSDVLVFASGPGASRFTGSQENTRVFWNLVSSLNPPSSSSSQSPSPECKDNSVNGVLTVVYIVLLLSLVICVWIAYRQRIRASTSEVILTSEMDNIEDIAVIDEEAC